MANEFATLRGEAEDYKERFEFTIEPFIGGGFMLSIRYSGDCRDGLTGAGVWPSIDKAKQIAEATTARLLDGAVVVWHEKPDLPTDSKTDDQQSRDDQKLEALRRAIDEGFASGIAKGDVFARVRAKLGLPPRSKSRRSGLSKD
jgi:hypothetical protein